MNGIKNSNMKIMINNRYVRMTKIILTLIKKGIYGYK